LPSSERIIYEAGTPLIKRYGEAGIRAVRIAANSKAAILLPQAQPELAAFGLLGMLAKSAMAKRKAVTPEPSGKEEPYVVADIKAIDRGETEVQICKNGGANGATVMGTAPVETINAFIANCESVGLDAMIDMMNVEFPIMVLSKLKKQPKVVVLHRGVDEEQFNKEKQVPFWAIQRIISTYNVLIAIAGGDTPREVQRAVFNGANIVVVWKNFYTSAQNTKDIADAFLNNTQ
jgi:3-keto-L-gulonate-6-phosphate decarboxylase